MHPYRLQISTALCILLFLSSRAAVVADGMVYSEVHYPKAVVPNQQALIHHAENVEHLVIETSYLSEGTNFAWVVPLPSTPQVSPVSENFFSRLQNAFQPTLMHPRWVARWRKRSLCLAAGLGIVVFLLLPKVDVEIIRRPPQDYGQAPVYPAHPVRSAPHWSIDKTLATLNFSA